MQLFGNGKQDRFYSDQGKGWLSVELPQDLRSLNGLLSELKESDDLTPEEKTWTQSLDEFVSHLDKLNGEIRKDKIDIAYITTFEDIAERLVSGYVRTDNPDCPACPTHNQNASWDSWRERISPKTYLARISSTPDYVSRSGITYPGDLVE
jgi:hypothetical protein